jgi:hypothetical protein
LTASAYSVYRHPPGLYRLARALRRASLLVLVLIILYTASVAYSAAETAQSAGHLSGLTPSYNANGTLSLSATLTIDNGGFYEVRGLTFAVRVANASGLFVAATQAGPSNLASQVTTTIPLNLTVPVSDSAAAASLLTVDQSLDLAIWANATFGYLFPLGLAVSDTRSWGAPFSDLQYSFGTPTVAANGTTVPVTLAFNNNSPLADVGDLEFTLLASSGTSCGAGSFVLDVPSGAPYSHTTGVTVANGCSLVGGSVRGSYVTPAFTLVLPPEPIP